MTPQELKYSILQLAIQGKLVEQRPEEGTAEELYQQIQEEKQKLIKDGKIKKGKSLPEITVDEIPFDIPESWKWVRLSQLFSVLNGDRGKNYPAKSTLSHEGIPFISALNLDGKSVIEDDNLLRLSEQQYERLGNGKLIRDDIVVCIRGSLGKHGRYPFDKGAIASSLVILRAFTNDDILAEFLMMYLDTPLFFSEIRRYDNGTAQPNLAAKNLEQFLVPLPPLAEQRRIVAKIEELLPYIDLYEKAWNRLEDLNKRFPVDMQKSILQMAIKGKLVEQRPEEGTAEELYKQIQAEKKELIKAGKIKKEKPLPEITEGEIPFDIPVDWIWIRLRDICVKIVDGDHNPPSGTKIRTEYLMLSAQNINNNTLVNLEKVRYLTKEIFYKENERTKVEKGDIFLTTVGTLGRSCVYEGNFNITFQRSVSVISTLIHNRYLKFVFDSPYIQQYMVSNSTGTAQKGFYLNQVENLAIPLPSLAEQKRIVAKLEEILPLCERLK